MVFTREDVDRLTATALAEKRYWEALVPFSAEIQQNFEGSLKPDSWGGLTSAAKHLAIQAALR